MQKRILILEDDAVLLETLLAELEAEGYACEGAAHGEAVLELTMQQRFDLYLFDINVPYIGGISLLEELRQSGDDTPTIFLTSRGKEHERLAGFSAGCDDYLSKPFSLAELKARISAILRRYGHTELLRAGDVQIDLQNHRLLLNHEEIEIEHKALEILALFAANPGKIISKAQIVERVYPDSEPSDTVIRVHISKINALFPQKRIVNIRGVGYRYEAV